MMSAYRMFMDRHCYSKGLTPGDPGVECRALDTWLEAVIEQYEQHPESLCFFEGATVRPARARAFANGPCLSCEPLLVRRRAGAPRAPVLSTVAAVACFSSTDACF